MSTTRDFIFKYAGKNPLEKLRDGEPYFFIRAQDKVAGEAVAAYADLIKRESEKAQADGNLGLADNLLKQSLGAMSVAHRILDWQMDHPEFVKLPD